MSKKTRILTVVVGAAALAGFTYTVARRGLLKRAQEGNASNDSAAPNQTADNSGLGEGVAARGWEAYANEWQGDHVNPARGSLPDPLDVAMNLDGIFDADADDDNSEAVLTARPDQHLPHPVSADDEDAPGPDDLGPAWLAQATQSERSLREADLTPELDELTLAIANLEDADGAQLGADDDDDDDDARIEAGV